MGKFSESGTVVPSSASRSFCGAWLFKEHTNGGSATAKGLPEARERLRVDSLPDTEKQAYYRDMEALRYQRSVIKTGWYEGRADGLAEGRAEGRKEGIEKGRKEGIEKGRKEGIEEGKQANARETAQRMKALGLPVETIAQVTQLSPQEIEKM